MPSPSIQETQLSDSIGVIVRSTKNASILDVSLDLVKDRFQEHAVVLFSGFRMHR
jgi:hypothetical protein